MKQRLNRTKLAPIADQIAANYRARNADLTDDNIWEEILEDVRHEAPGMDYFAMDMVVSMVAKRLGLKQTGVKDEIKPWWEEEVA